MLLSDGAETRGDALAAAAMAAARGVPIDVWAVEREPGAEMAIERVRMPGVADPGQPVELRIVTRATQTAQARVLVRRDGETIAEATAEVREGADVLTLREVAPPPGVHRYEVLLEPLDEASDRAAENNEGGAMMRVTGGSRALILTAHPEQTQALADALRGAGMAVEVAGVEGAPADLAELATWDLIVLSDLSARSLTETWMRELAAYVRDLGGGLLMAGARESFGLGGYAFTPVEEVLPATFDLRRRRDRASLAMVIAIDQSGSMGMEAAPGTSKLDLANEAAARSAMLLSPADRVAVAHVDTAVHWTQPMTTVDDPRRIAAAVRRAQVGGGGILVDLTLEASYAALRAQPTQLRHLLLFSDGSDSEEMSDARALVAAAARDWITTSVVSMGNGPDTPELEVLSRLGGGRFYIVEDLTELPRIFTEETVAASRAALDQEPARARFGEPAAVTRGLDIDAAPPLLGHAVVNARPRASLLLGIGEEDPLLLVQQQGVGRSAVWATDVGGAFARPWLSFSGYRALFGQLGRALARSPERRDAAVQVSLQGGTGRVVVEAIDDDGHTENYLALGATVAGPGGRLERVALTQTGAGRYEGRFAADAPGAYLVTVRENEEELVGSAGVVRARGDELRGEGTDHELLARIAALTGGQERRALDSIFHERPPPTWAYAPMWRPLLMAAAILLLLSVALRRLVWPSHRAASQAVEVRDASAALEIDAEPARAPSNDAASPAMPEPLARSAPAEQDAPDDDAPESGPPTEPASLAETLLARKKKR